MQQIYYVRNVVQMQLISYIHNAFYEKFVTLLVRLSVMPTKDLAPFSYISPQKPSFQ